jgi:superfamily II helicase
MIPRLSKRFNPENHYELREAFMWRGLHFSFIRTGRNLKPSDLNALLELFTTAMKIKCRTCDYIGQLIERRLCSSCLTERPTTDISILDGCECTDSEICELCKRKILEENRISLDEFPSLPNF